MLVVFTIWLSKRSSVPSHLECGSALVAGNSAAAAIPIVINRKSINFVNILLLKNIVILRKFANDVCGWCAELLCDLCVRFIR